MRDHLAGLAEHVAAGEPALLHGSGGERREPDDVAGRVDVRDGRLIIVIHDEFAAAIGLDAGCFDVEHVAIGLAADGIKQHLPAH